MTILQILTETGRIGWDYLTIIWLNFLRFCSFWMKFHTYKLILRVIIKRTALCKWNHFIQIWLLNLQLWKRKMWAIWKLSKNYKCGRSCWVYLILKMPQLVRIHNMLHWDLLLYLSTYFSKVRIEPVRGTQILKKYITKQGMEYLH